jgi:hypothetical protein
VGGHTIACSRLALKPQRMSTKPCSPLVPRGESVVHRQRWLPDERCLTTSGSRGLALAAHQIVMLRGLAKHLLHVFGQQIFCLH